jgi:hypothetical protein
MLNAMFDAIIAVLPETVVMAVTLAAYGQFL